MSAASACANCPTGHGALPAASGHLRCVAPVPYPHTAIFLEFQQLLSVMKKQVRSQIGNINQKAQFNSSFLNKSAIDIFQILLTKPIISISPSSAGCSFGCASPTLDPMGPNGQMKSRDPHQKLPRPPGSVKLRGSPLFSPRSWGQITHRFGMYQTAPPPLADHVDKRIGSGFFKQSFVGSGFICCPNQDVFFGENSKL